MPFEAYVGYLAEKEADIAAGTPIVIEVRDLETFERKIVRALVTKERPGPGADELWVLDWIEARGAEPWSIKVLEELEEGAAERSDIGEDDLRAAATESQKYAKRGHHGGTMPEMMGQEEIRKYYENIIGQRDKPRS